MYTTLRYRKERKKDQTCVLLTVRRKACLPESGSQFYTGKRADKIEHEEIGTCAGIETIQDAEKANQKVKRFSESS